MQALSAYRQAAAQADEPMRLVIMLYDQMVRDLRNAAAAVQQRDIEARAREMDHAFAVLGQLQLALDFDRGGVVAKQLDRFYNLLRCRLLEAQLQNSPELLHRQVENILSLREAWMEVERQTTARTAASGGKQPPPNKVSELGEGWNV